MSTWYTPETALSTSTLALGALGLHSHGTAKTHMFDAIGNGGDEPKRQLSIGRGADCDITIRGDRSVSGIHATLERDEGSTWVLRDNSTNGIMINGQHVREPVRLVAGMRIRLGRDTCFITVDDLGLVPVTTRSVDELCHLAFHIYGGYAEAGRRFDVGREFVRIHVQKWAHEQAQGR